MFPKAILSFMAALLALVSTNAHASSQRMALPPQTIVVGGGGGVGSVPIDRAYCIDVHRSEPTGDMTRVIGGNSPGATVTRVRDGSRLPLQDAMSQGWVRFSGTGEATGLTLTSVSGEEYKVEISKSVALSEDANDFSEDIESTLSWIDNQSRGHERAEWETDGPLDTLWQRRAIAAEEAIPDDVAYVSAFSSKSGRAALSDLWESRIRVERSGGGLALYGHVEAPSDAWDRVVIKAGEPARRFSGPNADRQVIEFLGNPSPGSTIEIARPDRLEQLGTMADQIAQAETEYVQAEPGSTEEVQASAKLDRLYELLPDIAVAIRSVQLSLLMADPGAWNGNSTFVISSGLPTDLGFQTLGVRSGVIAVVDGVGSFSGEPMLPSNLAAPYLSDQEELARITAYAEQGEAKWTLVAQSSQHRLPRLREIASDASAAMFNAVAADANEEAVVQDVEDVLKFNSLALEGLPTGDEIPVGEEIEVVLFLDDEQRLNMRLAVQIIEGNRRLAIASFDDLAR